MNRTIQVFNFSVQNAANDAVDIHIDGDIVDASTQAMVKAFWGDDTSTSFKSFRQQVANNPAKTYNVIINSNGGHVGDAMAMHDWILQKRSEGTTINTKGYGIVASAGTYILMAGEKPEMSKNSWFLIHNVSGFIAGDVNEIENYAKSLRKFNNSSRDYYAQHTGKKPEEITNLMNEGQFMSAEEAKKHGFIEKVTGEVAFKQTISKEAWQYNDMAVLNAYNSAVKLPEEDHKNYFDNKLEDMKNWIKNAIDSIKGTKVPETAEKQEILNAVVDGLTPHLETLDAQLETEVTNKVNDIIKGDAFKNAVKAEVEAITNDLKQKVADLTSDVTNKIGQPTSTPINGTPRKVVGRFEND